MRSQKKYLSEFSFAFGVHWSSALHHHRLHHCFQENNITALHFQSDVHLFNGSISYWILLFLLTPKFYLQCFLLALVFLCFWSDSCFVLFFSSLQVALLSPPLPLSPEQVLVQLHLNVLNKNRSRSHLSHLSSGS